MRNSIKNLALGLAVVGATALTACMGGTSNPAAASDEYGTVVIQTKAGNINQLSKPGLAKTSVIVLDSLIITAISNAATPDTVIIKYAAGENGFQSNSEINQEISVVQNLKALRTWAITAETFDTNGEKVQSGSATVANLLAGQVRPVTLTVNPLYSMYKATFNFPDSIFSPTGLFGQKLNITKIELEIDGSVVVDSVTTFAAATDYVLSYDYVSNDADDVRINVYGTLPGSDATWAAENLLYTREVAISSLDKDNVNTVTLDWEGPVDGSGSLTVDIGKVGTFEVTAQTPDMVLSKKK